MKALVTGATGFIGNRLCDLLQKEGYPFKVILRKKDEHLKESVICDLEREILPSQAFEGVTTVFHLAGHAHDLKNQVDNETRYTSLNIEASIKLAKRAAQMDVKRFIFVSSVKAGGTKVRGNLNTETTKGEPDGIYGKTKRKAEIRLLELAKETTMEITVLRPSLVYGANVKGNLLNMLTAIKKGWFPPLPDINNALSMIHVDDVVRALLFLATNNNLDGEIYIATDGKLYSSSEVYKILSKALGKKVRKWRVPFTFFKILAFLNSNFRNKVNKIFKDEAYSSMKLQSAGFKPVFTLKEIYEKAF